MTRRQFNTIVLLVFAGLYSFVSIGYSALSQSLTISGDLAYRYNGAILYDVLKNEANQGVYALEYKGAHLDSMNSSLYTKKIYHYYGANSNDGNVILNKNNVIFANHCWQMIRTTDTGGVKMIYNGEVENNQCLSTRGRHVGYGDAFKKEMNVDYWYGTDYTYDPVNHMFSVSGTKEFSSWNSTTGPGLVGKYTCGHSLDNVPCSTIYYIDSYIDSSNAILLSLVSNADYSSIGNMQYNIDFNSPRYVGYMYGDLYDFHSINLDYIDFKETDWMLIADTMEDNYYYSKTISKNGSVYTLDNPIRGSNIPEDSYAGYYTFASASVTSGAEVLYIFGEDTEGGYYTKQMTYPLDIGEYVLLIGESMTDNGNGTYTLTNTSYVDLFDWYNNYESYKNKYTCGDYYNTTCTNPRYIVETKPDIYNFVNAGEKIMVGKSVIETTLVDTILLRRDEWYDNYSASLNLSNFDDYKLTCGTTSANCTEQNLKFIHDKTDFGYYYIYNHYWGSSVTWDGSKYTLVNTIGINNYENYGAMFSHHYTCLEAGATSCTSVAYVYNFCFEQDPGAFGEKYILFENGVIDPSQVLSDMYTKNQNSSTIKRALDAWYKRNLLTYNDFIEDTIFCNNRSVTNLNGWDPLEGDITHRLEFKDNVINNDLSCPNITDRFSVSNQQAHLTYKIGLPTASELNLLNANNIRESSSWYWLSSPNYMHWYTSFINAVDSDGSISYCSVHDPGGLRPVISLNPGTKYYSGDGSMANPYRLTK